MIPSTSHRPPKGDPTRGVRKKCNFVSDLKVT